MVSPARRLAFEVQQRIDHGGAFANLALASALTASALDARDRAFATELVYGTTRMRRACDVIVDRFVVSEPDPAVRTALRLGAYQLAYMHVPAHAAVGETVALVPKRVRGFVNAVLRRVAADPLPRTWPSDAARLSYPDWILTRLSDDLGTREAIAALERMNVAPPVTSRPDGYVQDRASQWVAELVGAGAGERVADLCAAPGGKATALAETGAVVVALDLQAHRARLVAGNAATLRGVIATSGGRVDVVVGDATVPPLRAGMFDRVLLDAPCSGLGALRRRPDARWRITAADVDELAALQRRMIAAAANLVAPGGVLVYSVCTLTAAESVHHPRPAGFASLAPPGPPWRPYGDGARLLPHDADTDGMVVRRWRRDPARSGPAGVEYGAMSTL
jgi:16S rRNA (cytosine967-C5)-methyltransferase